MFFLSTEISSFYFNSRTVRPWMIVLREGTLVTSAWSPNWRLKKMKLSHALCGNGLMSLLMRLRKSRNRVSNEWQKFYTLFLSYIISINHSILPVIGDFAPAEVPVRAAGTVAATSAPTAPTAMTCEGRILSYGDTVLHAQRLNKNRILGKFLINVYACTK